MKHQKRLVLLHSNDLHGDFLAEKTDDRLIGGVSMLSGYIQQVRKQEQNVLYAISGDLFQGSVIDSEYKGISTIELVNMIAPDVAAVGNHEIDYGIGHLLFLEKCARFPIINANLYLTTNQIRLFRSHLILEVDGMKIMFIGALTEEVLAQARQETLVGSFVDVREAAQEIGRICNAYRATDIDLTVLLTHIGFEQDKKLAALLEPEWGVDLIVGGHSHTLLEQPCVVNGIPIVQAAVGTDQIGRFDLVIDTDRNAVVSYDWNLIPIDDAHCPRDQALESVLQAYKQETDKKYARYITRFERTLTHPARNAESEMGRLFADILRDNLGLDLMLLASGSLRIPEIGPIVDYHALNRMFPFHDQIHCITVTGKQLREIICHLFRPESFLEDHTEFYQFSSGMRVVVSRREQQVREISFEGAPVEDDRLFKVGLQTYHFKNMKEFLGIDESVVSQNAPCRVLATNVMDVLDEQLSRMELVRCPQDERWIWKP